jgi:hypothetical protein
MNRFLIAVAALSLAFPLVATGQSALQTAGLMTPDSEHEVHNLMKSAHSSDQYRQLAGYFHQREADYHSKAAAEMAERDRRAQTNAGVARKYPRPVDSAQYLYELYLSDAAIAAVMAQHYDQLAASPEPDHQQVMTSFPGGS